MEEETQRICFQLNPNFSLEQPVRSLAVLSGTHTLSIWEGLEWIAAGLNLEMFTTVLKKEDKGLSTGKMYENVLPNSIRDRNFLNDDILRYHEGHLGNCQMSRYLLAKSRGPALSSAASERKDNCIGLDAKVHLTNVDLREGEKMNDIEDENEMGIKDKKHKKLEPTTCKQQDKLDLTALTTNMIEDIGKKVKDKSIRRRILNWLNEVIHNYYEKKIAETYRREQEEGNQFYLSTFYFIRPMTRADRERQKRDTWLDRDNRRRKIKKYLNSYWEDKRKKKEALRIKEEEKWASEHGATVLICSPDEPKKRRSRWEERCLRVKEFFFQ